jgi:hypothetical protein
MRLRWRFKGKNKGFERALATHGLGLDGYGDIHGGTRQQEPAPVAMTFEDDWLR